MILLKSCKKPYTCTVLYDNCALFKHCIETYGEHDPLIAALFKQVEYFKVTQNIDVKDYTWGDSFNLEHTLWIYLPQKLAFFRTFIKDLLKKDGFLNLVSPNDIRIDKIRISIIKE
jgi:hypothetical protein